MADDANDKPPRPAADPTFRSAVSGTRKLKPRKRHLASPPRPPKTRAARQDQSTLIPDGPSKPPDETDVEFGDRLLFQRPQVSRSVMRQLRRGKHPIQDEIDLHGLTAGEAQTILHEFLADCSQRQLKCVRVIHGKGLGSGPDGPVLKMNVNRWMRQWPEVLAFCSAADRDGGSGAVYVLLRSRPS